MYLFGMLGKYRQDFAFNLKLKFLVLDIFKRMSDRLPKQYVFVFRFVFLLAFGVSIWAVLNGTSYGRIIGIWNTN
jgi:hypothetical protein